MESNHPAIQARSKMTNRVQFLICVFILIAGSGRATGTNDPVMQDSSSSGNAVNDIAEAKVDPAVYDSLVGRYDYGKLRVLRVTRDGNHIFAQFAGRNCEIFPKSE